MLSIKKRSLLKSGKCLVQQSVSQRHVLHITYIESKRNIPNYKPVCWRQWKSKDSSQAECFKIAHRIASVTTITQCVWGELTESFNCACLSLKTSKQILRFLSACLYSYCLWHVLNTYQQKWSISVFLLNLLLIEEIKGRQRKNDYLCGSPPP